jgi:hypothetical protein
VNAAPLRLAWHPSERTDQCANTEDQTMPTRPHRQRAFPSILAGLAVTALALLGTTPAPAQEYPTRPITLVVPFPPGGGNDAMARIVGEELGKVLGQRLVVENKGGAGGVLGTTSGRSCSTGRLHAASRPYRHAWYQPSPLQERHLRSQEGLCTCWPSSPHSAGDGREPCASP